MSTSLATILLFLGLLVGADRSRPEHPQDGPDVDLRVRIDQDRVEIQARLNLAFADEFIERSRTGLDFVAEAELPAFGNALEALLRRQVRVKVDGRERPADRVEFEEEPWEPDDAEFFPRMGLRAVQRFRLVLSHRLETAPAQVAVYWGLYPPDRALEGIVDQRLALKAEWSAGREIKIVDLRAEEPEYVWHAPAGTFARPIPVRADETRPGGPGPLVARVIAILALAACALAVLASAGSVGRPRALTTALAASLGLGLLLPLAGRAAATLDDAEARAVLAERLRGVYDAFSYERESDVYDALATSVSDRLIGPIYDQVFQQLVMREEGGAVARVSAFGPLESTVIERDDEAGRIVLDARWQVAGEVYHWGHTHARVSRHHARYVLGRGPRGWLIDAVEALAQERLEPIPGSNDR